MSAYNYSFNNPVMFNDPSGADPKDGDPKPQPKQQTGSIAHKKPIQPLFGQSILMPPLQKSDHPEDDSKGNVIRSVQLKEAVAKNQATAKQAEMVRNVKLDERHIGATKDGQCYNVSQREIKRAEYESNEAYGSMVRNGGLGVGLAYAVGGKEAVKYGALVDGIAMSFAGVGTPYGKTESTKPIERPFVPITEAPLGLGRPLTSKGGVVELGIKTSLPIEHAPQENQAYELALNGGKHSGWMKNMMGRSTSELQKSQASMEANIIEHQNLISDPAKYLKAYEKGDWNSLDPRRQQNLLNVKWPGDIQRAQQQINILQGIIKSR